MRIKASGWNVLYRRIDGFIHHILPPFISVIYLSVFGGLVEKIAAKFFVFIIVALLMAGYGYLMNDIFDRQIDKKAGKANMAEKLHTTWRILLPIFLLILSFVLFYFFVSDGVACILLISQSVLLTIYATPPLRLKNLPVLGPLCDIHYSHIIPVFISIWVFMPISEISMIPIFFVYPLLFLKGSRNILLHQVEDRKGDRQSSIVTFPLKFGPRLTMNLINKIILPLEWISVIMLIVFFLPESYPVFIIFVVFNVFYYFNFALWKYKWQPRYQKKFRFVYLLNDFYEIWFPVGCILAMPVPLPTKLMILACHLLLFYKGSLKTVKDLVKIRENLNNFD